MSLIDKIENIQKKPEAVRKRVLFVSMIIIMFVIIAVWVATLRFSLVNEGNNKEKNQANYSPFGVLKNIVNDGLSASSTGIKDIKEVFSQLKNKYGGE